MKNNDKEKNEFNKTFKQFLLQKQHTTEINKKAQKYRHPFIYANYKRHQYASYALKHRQSIESVSGLTRKQGFNMMKDLYHDLPVTKKLVIILCIIIMIWCVLTSLI